MSSPALLTLAAWARLRDRSPGRALELCQLGRIPGAIPVGNHRGSITYIIPADAPWPAGKPGNPLIPPGWVNLSAWARSHKKDPGSAHLRLHQGDIPSAKSIGPGRPYYIVPADLPWPERRRGRPRIHPIPQGAPSGCSQGAGESRGGRPASEAA